MPPRPRKVFQFKITLQEVRPPVWRTIHVPVTYSFWDLHVAIQDAMGWKDYHLHEFQIPNPTGNCEDHIGIPDDHPFEGDEPFLPGWDVQISDYFSPENPTALYIYDFGDDWQHLVQLEEILPRVPRGRYPLCVAGQRRCPPEDVGGAPGYEDFLEAIRDPHHEENARNLEWVGGSFDPESFHPDRVRFDSPKKRWRIAFRDGI